MPTPSLQIEERLERLRRAIMRRLPCDIAERCNPGAATTRRVRLHHRQIWAVNRGLDG